MSCLILLSYYLIKTLSFIRFTLAALIKRETRSTTVNGTTTTYTVTIPKNQKRAIFRKKVVLHAYKAILNPGRYVFPFKFTLDSHIPGSYYVHHGESKGSIAYKLKAEVAIPGMFKANIKHTQFIHVGALLYHPIKVIQTQKDANVTYMCCFDMGQVTCSAIIDKNAYVPGETATLTLYIDNTTSDVNLKHVSFKLLNNINLTALDYSESFQTVACENKIPSIPKGETAHVVFPLTFPHSLSPSTSGYLIRSTYEFAINLSIPCSSDVTLNLPVTVYNAASLPVQPSIASANSSFTMPNMASPGGPPPQYENPFDIKADMFKNY